MGMSALRRFCANFLMSSQREIQNASKDVEKDDYQDPDQFVIALKIAPDDIDQGDEREQDPNG